jgi:hypothetical protein
MYLLPFKGIICGTRLQEGMDQVKKIRPKDELYLLALFLSTRVSITARNFPVGLLMSD